MYWDNVNGQFFLGIELCDFKVDVIILKVYLELFAVNFYCEITV